MDNVFIEPGKSDHLGEGCTLQILFLNSISNAVRVKDCSMAVYPLLHKEVVTSRRGWAHALRPGEAENIDTFSS